MIITHYLEYLDQHLGKAIQSAIANHGATSETTKWMNMVKAESAKKIPDHNRLRTMGKSSIVLESETCQTRPNSAICFYGLTMVVLGDLRLK